MTNTQPILSQNTNQNNTNRTIPVSELDFQYRMADPAWGKGEVPAELRDKLAYVTRTINEDGSTSYDTESLWGLLGFYTRDMRLANLSSWNNEFEYCQYYLDLAGDLLREGHIESFLTALSRVITVLELSQSKTGFLRKILNTFRNEQQIEMIEPKKSNLWGAKKGGGQQ